MWNRRTWLIALAALGLIALPPALVAALGAQWFEAPPPGYRITLQRDGKPIRVTRSEQLPRDLAAEYPEVVAGSPYALIVEPEQAPTAGPFGRRLSATDRSMVEFLLLLPPATLLVCLFRNLIGLNSFGTFAPALLGLAFRDVSSFLGVFVVLIIISAGWWLRRGLNALQLLQAPRAALMLSSIVVVLLAIIVALSGSGPRAITLFPMVILTGMIERFWSMEENDSGSSLGVLASTLFIAGCVWALAAIPSVPRWLMSHPETLGPVMAGQLLLGRYTGFRVLELYRFRAMMIEPATPLASSEYSPPMASDRRRVAVRVRMRGLA